MKHSFFKITRGYVTRFLILNSCQDWSYETCLLIYYLNSAFFNVGIEKKLGQICQSYDDIINIFFKWEATIPIRLFDRAYFSEL
jgi:hypothetical protein